MTLMHLLVYLLSVCNICGGKNLKKDLTQFRSDTKSELARNLLKPLLTRNDVAKVILSRETDVEVNITRAPGLKERLFRRFEENFLFNGTHIFQLRKGKERESTPGDYFWDIVNEFLIDEGALFFKEIDWQKIFFFVVCNRNGYCQGIMSHLETGTTVLQRIATRGFPTDLEFFVDDGKLYLVIAADTTTVLRWAGAYFDEYEQLDTSGATSVAAFRDKDAIIIVVARRGDLKKVYSKVFFARYGKIELIQMLDTTEPSKVVPYRLRVGEENLGFILVIENQKGSKIFWWNGREFSLWKTIDELIGPCQIYADLIDSELFFFVVHQNSLSIYHSNGITFDLSYTALLERDILGFDLRKEPDHPPFLLLLTSSDSEPFLTFSLLSISIHYIPNSESQIADADPVLQCLLDLDKKITDRDVKINESLTLSEEIKKENGIIRLENLNIPHVELKNFKINSLKVNPKSKELEATPEEIKKELEELRRESEALFQRLASAPKQVRCRIQGDLTVERLKAPHIQVNKFSGRVFDFGNILSVTKNQTLGGAIWVETLKTGILTVPSLNGIHVNELFLRNKPVQEIMGEQTILNMAAERVIFGKLGKLNGSIFFDATKTKTKVIRENKILERMTINHLQVDNINNMPAEKWLSKILPSSEAFGRKQDLSFKDLNVANMSVANVNGQSWKNYLEALLERTSNARPVNNMKVKRLVTSKINGIAAKSFLTKDTPQNVSSTIKVNSARAIYIKPKHFSCNWSCNKESPRIPSPKKRLKSFESVALSEVIFNKKLNISGIIIDLEKLNETFWMKTIPQVIENLITFAEGVTLEKAQIYRVNKYSLNNFVKVNETNDIVSEIIYEDAVVNGDFIVSPRALLENNLRRLLHFSVKTGKKNYISGKKTFLGDVTVNKLFSQVLNDTKVTREMLVDPIEIGASKLNQLEIFGNISIKYGITLNRLNGHSFANLTPKISEEPEKRSSTERKRNKWENVRLIIKGDLKVPEITAKTANGILLDEYLSKVVLKNGKNRIIKGRTSFRGSVTVKGNLDGILNGYDLTELRQKALSKTEPQNITGTFTVDVLGAGSIESKVFAGISVDDILFQDNSEIQNINSDIIFSDVALAGNLEALLPGGCNLTKVGNMNKMKVKKLGKLDVKGNLRWDKDRKDYRGISYLYKNAVLKKKEQILSGSVTFQTEATFEKLNTKNNIGNIDLGFIIEDALYRSISVQEISQDITFKGTLSVDSVLIVNNAIVDVINGLDILDFGQTLVRNSRDTQVTGKKEFLHGFSTFHMNIDTINNSKTEHIIFCDSEKPRKTIKFPPTKFHSVKTVEDLNLLILNGINISDLINQRLSKTQNQTVYCNITIVGSLILKDGEDLSRINDINISDTIPVSGEAKHRFVKGTIEINETLSINKKLRVETLNKGNIKEIYERALLNEKESIIRGNIVFSDDMGMEGNMDVIYNINDCDMIKIHSLQIPRNFGREDREYSEKIQTEINKMANASHSFTKPIVFTELKVKSNVFLQFLSIEKVYHVSDKEFHAYGLGRGEICGVPSNCSCPIQAKITNSFTNPESLSTEIIYPRYYNYNDEILDVQVVVKAKTPIYSSKCEFDGVGTVELAWTKMRNISEMDDANRKLNFTGSLNDVKFFRIANSIYVLLAFSLTSIGNGTRALNVVVMEIETESGKVKKVQDLRMEVAQVLDTFWTPKGIILVTGNGYDSEVHPTDSIESSIYRFNDLENEFQLLRSINTHGILSIASVRHNKDSFIFLTQKQSWPFLILKYNHEYDNYYLSQKLDVAQSRVKSNFLSGAAFTTARTGYEGEIFLGVVQSDESFRLFRYKHIEGFVEELSQEQDNVKMLWPFSRDSNQYLFAVSPGRNSVIYQLVHQGFMN